MLVGRLPIIPGPRILCVTWGRLLCPKEDNEIIIINVLSWLGMQSVTNRGFIVTQT